MNRFEPALKPKDVALNCRTFVKEHKRELKEMMKPIYPYLLVLLALSMYITYILQLETINFMKTMPPAKSVDDFFEYINKVQENSYSSFVFYLSWILNIAVGYCFAILAISWHRLVLLGKGQYETVSFLYPKKNEIQFVVLWTFLSALIPTLISITGFNAVAIFCLFLLPYICFKISFCLPARALDTKLSFSQSFKLSNGYFWKFLFATLRSTWRLILVLVVLGLVFGIIGGAVAKIIYAKEITAPHLAGAYSQIFSQQIGTALMVLFFQPLFTVIGVTVLSNYYQHALRNKIVE